MPETNEEVKELDLADIKNRLLKLKAQLEHDIDMKEQQVAESGDDLVPERGGVGNHMADDANETAEQETMITLQRNTERELDQVNQALTRLENGTYGKCANCGRPIPAARLEARPYSIYDIACQELADRGKL
jgi:RNA polymerase-binding transcription factor DksA